MYYKLKYLLFLVIIYSIFIITACSDEIVAPNIGDSKSYFPATTGNQWDFYLPPSDSVYSSARILDEFLNNGQKYYILSFIEDVSQSDTISIDNNIIYRHRNNFKEIWIDFNILNNQTYKYGDAIVTVKTGLVIETKLGTFKDCTSFNFNVPFLADEEITYFFSKGVGIVKIESAWISLLLLNYNLN